MEACLRVAALAQPSPLAKHSLPMRFPILAPMDRLLDSRCAGPHYLHNPEIAEMVTAAIYHRDQRVYQLHSFVVMPNHVHLLITPLEAVSKVMQSLKRFTAREANRRLWLTGQPFWHDAIYGRRVRNH